jgi:hypothetical protein
MKPPFEDGEWRITVPANRVVYLSEFPGLDNVHAVWTARVPGGSEMPALNDSREGDGRDRSYYGVFVGPIQEKGQGNDKQGWESAGQAVKRIEGGK